MEDELKKKFIKRTKKHIKLVNKYAKILGKKYPNHDRDKLGYLCDSYKYFLKKNLDTNESNLLDSATLVHILKNKHHPEYWTSTDLSGFTRVNYTPNGIIDASDMDDDAIYEMVCDWAAVSEEKDTNTVLEWFESVNNVRWKFTEKQQALILDIIGRLQNDS